MCNEWCASRRISPSGLAQINFTDAQYDKISIPFPREFLGCVSLMQILESVFSPEMPGSLLWMRDWGIWSEATEEVGIAFWKKFRPEEGRDSLLEYPGHLLSEADLESLRALLLLPIIFQWDAQWFSSNGESIISIKHDGLLEVMVRGENTKRIVANIEAYLKR